MGININPRPNIRILAQAGLRIPCWQGYSIAILGLTEKENVFAYFLCSCFV